MADYDKNAVFRTILQNDPKIEFDVTDEVLAIGHLLGTNPQVLKELYKSYRKLNETYEYKPMIGSKLSVEFHYEAGQVRIERQQVVNLIPMHQFLLFIGRVDAVYSEILPIGTVVELDVEMMPEIIQDMFKSSETGELVTVSGRKIPLITGFENYIVDYLGRLWPFGEIPGSNPIFVSNMMIKRVVSLGLKNEWEDEFVLNALRTTQVSNEQVSTAFMTNEDALRYYQTLKISRESNE